MCALRVLALLLAWLPLQAYAVQMLRYRVQEPELAPYVSRILVTDAFVRLDEGAGSRAGYTLYNRVSHRIFNVDPQEQTVLILTLPDAMPPVPRDLKLEQQLQAMPDAPVVAGHRPHTLKLYANGRLCRILQVLPGVMEPALQGLRELRSALARLRGAPLPGAPEDPCDQAEHWAAPTRALDHGLPLVDRTPGGQQRWLLDFDPNFRADEALFQVPAEYETVLPPAWTQP